MRCCNGSARAFAKEQLSAGYDIAEPAYDLQQKAEPAHRDQALESCDGTEELRNVTTLRSRRVFHDAGQSAENLEVNILVSH